MNEELHADVAVLKSEVAHLKKSSGDQESRLRLLESASARLGGKAAMAAAVGSAFGAAALNLVIKKLGG